MDNLLTELEKMDGKRSLYRCQCGNTAIKHRWNVKRGITRSCGCISRAWKDSGDANRSHGRSSTPEYSTWSTMKQRCCDPSCKSYPRYGGKGVTVCERWMNSFENFFQDMGERPSNKHSIDRIEGTKGYDPSNCRWATPIQQANNRVSIRKLDTSKGQLTVSEAARAYGIKRTTLRNRLYAGWTVEAALQP